MSNSKLTKSFNFTLGCIVLFSRVTPTKKASEKIKKKRATEEGDGERQRGREGREGETNNNNNN